VRAREKDNLSAKVEALIRCPPATKLALCGNGAVHDSPLLIGAQDCHENPGAHTGDISAEMIADCFGTYVIVGHSERRTDHKPKPTHLVRAKAEAAYAADLTPSSASARPATSARPARRSTSQAPAGGLHARQRHG
jgi:triosephosphate isomerase